MPREVELAEIPSDPESDDGLCPSDDENEGDTALENENEKNTSKNVSGVFEVENLTEDSDDEDAESDNNAEGWKNETLPRCDIPFTKEFGPNIPNDATTPLDIYVCLFPRHLLDLIVAQSNLYITQKKSKQNHITTDELLVFLGINILMGIKKSPSYRDYWSSNPQLHDSYISSLMTVNRFGFILNHLHLNDNTKEPKKGETGYDKLYKIRPLIDELNKTFKQCWKPGKYQSVDETMIKFKGRSSLKQYMPNKPIKRGFKAWTRADESGFVCDFQIYTGKTDSPEAQLGTRVVKDLTRELIGNNHVVVQDNYFTSPNLLLSLKKDNIFSVGTIRKNRRGLPKSQIPDKTLKPGQFEFQTSTAGLRWIKWMDKKAVHFLSNYHDPTEVSVTNRRQKDGSLLTVACPVMCKDYNTHMGHVDESDQTIAAYKIDRKSKRWWMRLFWHYQDTIVGNAYVIYVAKDLKPSMTHKKFRLRLIEQLVGNKLPTKRGRKSKSWSLANNKKPQVSPEKRRCEALHMPVSSTNRRRCALCSTKEHQVSTTWMCETCQVPLCIKNPNNCFKLYHS